MPADSGSVAIVDDDAELVRSYELLFRSRNIPVAFVSYDGRSALDLFWNAAVKPAAVIVDYRMPSMSGIELAIQIKKMSPGTRIILISADDSARQEAMSAGVDVFLKKPAGLKAILESIGMGMQ